MPVREVLVCSKCGAQIEEDPMLGDKQGAVRQVVHGGTTWRITLCAKCARPLWDLYWDYVDEVLPGGTAHGPDVFKYLPRADEPDGVVKPPMFSGEG